jgi:hypothetical protein
MIRMLLTLSLLLVGCAVALVVSTPKQAVGACRCACVNGEVVPLCSNSLDLPPICPPRICPIVPPSIEPIQRPRIPPLGTSECRMKQVLNNATGRYEWREVCY